MTKPKYGPPTISLGLTYVSSPEAWAFHNSSHRFRYLIWGIKSGKSLAGAVELCRLALADPGSLNWVVAPTFNHLDVSEREVVDILTRWPGLIRKRNTKPPKIWLQNGAEIQFKSADYPDNLRGPNVDNFWADEGAYIKPEAWEILRQRVSATRGDGIVTTTPNGRNWLWAEVLEGGMPASQDYGEFSKGQRFVSHHPTWRFPWVDEDEVREVRRMTTKLRFDQEWGALFISDANMVFQRIEEAMSHEPILFKSEQRTSIGVDLAKFQDRSAVVVMDGNGRSIYTDSWGSTTWSVQVPRIIALSKRFNGALIVDRSNVGSAIEEQLRAGGALIHSVDMNDWRIKEALIQGLQVAFEQGLIKIPDPRAKDASVAGKILIDELRTYEYKLTKGGRLSYSAPKGLHDDMVIALALANYGRGKGYTGIGGEVITVAVPGRELRIRAPKLGARSRVFSQGQPQSRMNWGRSERFW